MFIAESLLSPRSSVHRKTLLIRSRGRCQSDCSRAFDGRGLHAQLHHHCGKLRLSFSPFVAGKNRMAITAAIAVFPTSNLRGWIREMPGRARSRELLGSGLTNLTRMVELFLLRRSRPTASQTKLRESRTFVKLHYRESSLHHLQGNAQVSIRALSPEKKQGDLHQIRDGFFRFPPPLH